MLLRPPRLWEDHSCRGPEAFVFWNDLLLGSSSQWWALEDTAGVRAEGAWGRLVPASDEDVKNLCVDRSMRQLCRISDIKACVLEDSISIQFRNSQSRLWWEKSERASLGWESRNWEGGSSSF